MQHVLASSGLPTPPASPLSFDHPKCIPAQQHFFQPAHPALQHRAPRYVPVVPEDRIGSFLGGSLQLTGIIGNGAYGVVYEAVDVKTNVRYAVKALSKLNPDGTPLDARQIEYQTREIRLHYMASAHPNVVSMHKIIDAYPDCLFVVLEYCPEGDLFYNITECGQFVGKDELARKVFLQILDAVQYLHQSGIYHRDLKPENILVADHGETLKLADFGLATASDRSEDYGCGSTFYMSPECLGQTNSKRPYYYCAPNDVWSLGVILVNLTCGRNPWKQASSEDSTYRTYVRNQGFLKTILPLTDELDDILARIFNPVPEQRISLAELRHRIVNCSQFTVSPQQQVIASEAAAQQQLISPPASPERSELANVIEGVPATPEDYAVYDDEDAIVDDDFDALSPVSSNPSSLASSSTSTSSSCSSVDALVEDDDCDIFLCQDLPEITTPPPQVVAGHTPPTQCDLLSVYEAEDAAMVGLETSFHIQQQQQQQQQHQQHQQQLLQQPSPPPFHHFTNTHMPQNYVTFAGAGHAIQQQQLPMPPGQLQHILPQQHMPMLPPQQAPRQALPCGGPSKFFLWDWMVGKNAQPVQQLPAHQHHLSILPLQQTMFMQGCY